MGSRQDAGAAAATAALGWEAAAAAAAAGLGFGALDSALNAAISAPPFATRAEPSVEHIS